MFRLYSNHVVYLRQGNGSSESVTFNLVVHVVGRYTRLPTQGGCTEVVFF